MSSVPVASSPIESNVATERSRLYWDAQPGHMSATYALTAFAFAVLVIWTCLPHWLAS